MFRAVESGGKALYYYQNEAKYQENKTSYKGVVPLSAVKCIQQHDPEKRHQFLVEVNDGAVCFFEAASPTIAQDWVICLNAVLFGKDPNGGM